MSENNITYDEAKLELIKSNANMYLTFNAIKGDKSGLLYCALEDIVEMIDPQAEGSCIYQYRKNVDSLSETEKMRLYDRCSMVPMLAYTMFDYIKGAFDVLDEKKQELFDLTQLDFYVPEITGEINGMLGLTRNDFWRMIKELKEEFPWREDLPKEALMRAGEDYAIRMVERLQSDLNSKEIIPNEVLLSNIKTLIGNKS